MLRRPACAGWCRVASKHEEAHFCYEAGPTGYGLHRLITSMGHPCTVAAPSLIPRKPGDRVKTNRRDAIGLAKLLRAGELTAVWVPDAGHEAMRDLVRARAAAVELLGVCRQQVSAFMLKHGRVCPRKRGWTMRYLCWLQEQSFDHPAHQIALQAMVEAVRVAKECQTASNRGSDSILMKCRRRLSLVRKENQRHGSDHPVLVTCA